MFEKFREILDKRHQYAEDWNCDGTILSLNRGCTLTAKQMEVKRALKENRIPALLY